jgi:hypothetical protein
MKRHLLLGAAVALAFGAGLVTQSMVGAQAPVPPKDIIKEEPLVGGNSQDMLMQIVTIAPNAVTPWHIHPDGHEITYVLEGALKLQVDKQPDLGSRPARGSTSMPTSCIVAWARRAAPSC